jgi:hypothetical protein
MQTKSDLDKRIAELSPQKRVLLALRLQQKQERLTQTIPRRKEEGHLELSYNQEGLWFLDQLEPDSPRFCLSGTLRLQGTLNVKALEQAINEIIRRHEALRTTFTTIGEEPVQVIAPVLTLDLTRTDLRAFPESERESQATQLVAEEAMRSFDLTRGPLIRVKLLSLADEEHLLLLTTHHIISDGQSLVILVNELAAHYETFLNDAQPAMPDLPIQYADFAQWQRRWLDGQVLETQLDYWKGQLRGKLPMLELPLDRPRPRVQTYWSADQTLFLPNSLFGPLKALAKDAGATVFMAVLAVFFGLLHRFTGQDDIIVGSPIAGRRWTETESVIGYFVNMLALRVKFSAQMSFAELLQQVREVVLGAYAHQDLPFGKLVAALQPERSLNRTPLFQVVFILIDSLQTIETNGLKFNPLQIDKQTVKYDIIIFIEQNEEGLKVLLMYNTDLFDHSTISRLLASFQTLLEGMVVHPGQPLLDLPIERTDVDTPIAFAAAPSDSDEEAQFLF